MESANSQAYQKMARNVNITGVCAVRKREMSVIDRLARHNERKIMISAASYKNKKQISWRQRLINAATRHHITPYIIYSTIRFAHSAISQVSSNNGGSGISLSWHGENGGNGINSAASGSVMAWRNMKKKNNVAYQHRREEEGVIMKQWRIWRRQKRQRK